MPRVLAFDIGGTYIKAAHAEVGEAGTSLGPVTRIPTEIGDGSRLVAQLVELAASLGRAESVGVVTPGILDEPAGVIGYSTNLQLRNFPLAKSLQSALGLPVKLAHDGRAAALAELKLGSGRGRSNFALMPIGTGISVGLIADGTVLRSDGYAGEIGHADVGQSYKCGCGLIGCFEAVAATSAINRNYESRSGRALGTAEIIAAATAGDEVAAAVWNEALDSIAVACGWLMNTVSPQAIAFAGGLSKAGRSLVEPVEHRLRQRVSFQRVPDLVIAELGDDAGCLGAALIGSEAL